MSYQPGDQIAYIPPHAEDDITHPDVEIGFVTSLGKSGAWCRFWHKNMPGILRTRANSALVHLTRLRKCHSVPQRVINEVMADIDRQKHSQAEYDSLIHEIALLRSALLEAWPEAMQNGAFEEMMGDPLTVVYHAHRFIARATERTGGEGPHDPEE